MLGSGGRLASASKFAKRACICTRLHRIVVNAALGRLRSRHRHPEKSIELLSDYHALRGERDLRVGLRRVLPNSSNTTRNGGMSLAIDSTLHRLERSRALWQSLR
jgi:hypothetical protein